MRTTSTLAGDTAPLIWAWGVGVGVGVGSAVLLRRRRVTEEVERPPVVAPSGTGRFAREDPVPGYFDETNVFHPLC